MSGAKRGKTRATKSRLVWVLLLIGRESGARFFNQSQGEVKQNQRKKRITDSLTLSLLNWGYNPFAIDHFHYDVTRAKVSGSCSKDRSQCRAIAEKRQKNKPKRHVGQGKLSIAIQIQRNSAWSF